MKPQPIATAPSGMTILAYLPSSGWITGSLDTYGTFYSTLAGCVYYPTHWTPLPEPPTPKQAYVFLEEGDIIEDGDEFCDGGGEWYPAWPCVVGGDVAYQKDRDCVNCRRKVPTPNPES